LAREEQRTPPGTSEITASLEFEDPVAWWRPLAVARLMLKEISRADRTAMRRTVDLKAIVARKDLQSTQLLL
jgi:hypothetical protein